MKEKEAKGWIQPLELEYYYKCAKILNRIPADISEGIGIKHIEEKDIEEIKSDKFINSNFMKNFIFASKNGNIIFILLVINHTNSEHI